MNTPLNDDDHLEGVFGRALESMAHQASPAQLHAALPSVRRKIGLRRAAKITGVAAGSFALAAAVGVGAWAAPWRDAVTPVQPATPTPSTSPTPTPAPTPTPSVSPTQRPGIVTDTTALDDPRFVTGQDLFPATSTGIPELSSLACGDPVTELASLAWFPGLTLTDPQVGALVSTVTVTNTGTSNLTGYGAHDPSLVWVQDGRIVSAEDWTEGGGPFGVAGATQFDRTPKPTIATGESFTSWAGGGSALDGGWACGPRSSSPAQYLYDASLPAGDYAVYALTIVQASSDAPWQIVLSDPVGVTAVPPDAPSSGSASRVVDGQALPGDIPGYPAGWVCGAPAADVLAATSTDRLTLETVGDPAVDGVLDGSGGPVDFGVQVLARITDVSGRGLPDTYTAGDPLMLWTQQGRIVGGRGWSGSDEGSAPVDSPFSADPDVPGETRYGFVDSLAAGESVGVSARASFGEWTCGPQAPLTVGTSYPEPFPSGSYDVYLVSWYMLDGANPHLIASNPVTVVVP